MEWYEALALQQRRRGSNHVDEAQQHERQNDLASGCKRAERFNAVLMAFQQRVHAAARAVCASATKSRRLTPLWRFQGCSAHSQTS